MAELATNAVTHGLLAGRDFTLRLALCPSRALRIEVSDPRPDIQPPCRPAPPPAEEETGRGLVLLDALVTRWGVCGDDRPARPGKTVWAELELS